MSESAVKKHDEFSLPPTVVSRLDVSRLVSEVEQVDSELTTAAVRKKTGNTSHHTPVMSEQLADFLELNDLTIDENSTKRSELVKQLRLLKDHVPVVHMTFAVTADRESLQTLIVWLRESVHPQSVIAVGLQPGLVAGVYLRTPNRVHDFSLRTALNGRHDLLVKELEAVRG